MQRTSAALAEWLGPAYGGALSFRADTDGIDALSSERDALWARLEKSTFLTDDEKRAAVGYGPKGADNVTKLFNPNQPRDPHGRWSPGDGSDADVLPVAGKRPSIPTVPAAPKQPQKVTKPGQSGADAAKDVPSWVKGNAPNVGESSDDFARRLLAKQYPGTKNFDTGADSEYSKIKKWGDRNFVDPKS